MRGELPLGLGPEGPRTTHLLGPVTQGGGTFRYATLGWPWAMVRNPYGVNGKK